MNGNLDQRERAQNENDENTITASDTVRGLPDANDGVNLTFDFALKNFSPELRRRTMEMLKSIPKADKQSVSTILTMPYPKTPLNRRGHVLAH
jgi:hypothetical protein